MPKQSKIYHSTLRKVVTVSIDRDLFIKAGVRLDADNVDRVLQDISVEERNGLLLPCSRQYSGEVVAFNRSYVVNGHEPQYEIINNKLVEIK